MRFVIYFLSLLVLLGINISLYGLFPVWGAVPNLLLLWVLFFSAEKNSFDFYFVALMAGFLLDFNTQLFIGGFAVAFLLSGLLMNVAVNYFIAIELNWKSWLVGLLFFYIVTLIIVWAYNKLFFSLHFSSFSLDFIPLLKHFGLEFFYTFALLFLIQPLYEVFNRFVTKYFSFKQGL